MLDAVICPACGAKLREDRERCLRCGAAVRLDTAPARHPSPFRRRLLLGALLAIGVLTLAGVAIMGPPTTAPAPVAAPAEEVGTSSSASVPAAPANASSGPSQSTNFAPVTAQDSERVALAAYGRGDMQTSIEQLTRAVERGSNDPNTLNNLAQVLVRAGRVREAIPYFDRAIALSQGTWSYHFNRAKAYGELQQWGRAISGYREALQLFPDDYATQFNLAKALQANGDLSEALATYERAIELAPGQADFLLSYGRALEAARRPADARAAYGRFLELAPDAPEADKVKGQYDRLQP